MSTYINSMCYAWLLCHVQFFVIPWTVQPARLLCPWRFSREEYWSGVPGSPPRDLPNAGIESGSPALQVDFLPAKQPGKPYINTMATTNQKLAISESEVAQSCPTLCDRMDCNPPSSSIHGIFQARVLEWIAIFFPRGSSQQIHKIQKHKHTSRGYHQITREGNKRRK